MLRKNRLASLSFSLLLTDNTEASCPELYHHVGKRGKTECLSFVSPFPVGGRSVQFVIGIRIVLL